MADQTKQTPYRRKATTRGFAQTGSLLTNRIRSAGEKRGFSQMRLLTDWDSIVGAEIAAMALPEKVSYARDGFGATLVVHCQGANAPVVDMQRNTIRDRVNACYGYNAISRVRVTQTGHAGFAETQTPFAPAEPNETACAEAHEAAKDVENSDLRLALEQLGRHVLSNR